MVLAPGLDLAGTCGFGLALTFGNKVFFYCKTSI